ncbi:N amino acid transport system protein [Coniochaeta hoffmannii]|uniref:N amino acid transport system protein n=1 Tax=Coniochaeta hoffmannii TaxID=91930 RepID=A0AA38R597_9PEZI|nr:N amino acid transport system protein [Coniochaeta hoffmannii]
MPSTEVDNTEAKAGMSADKAGVKPTVAFRPQDRALYDSKVTLEEYMYYASKTRAEEDANAAQEPKTTLRDILFPSGGKAHLASTESTGALDQLKDVNLNKAENRTAVSALEWTNASRALRSASAAAAFYLITTDILGPFGVGFALGTMGWGQGIALFTVFGACAGCSGYLLWKVFLHVDSYEFAARNYGDLAFRIWGRWFRHVFNVLQVIQLTLSVGLIVISNGQSISQVSKFRLCYIVCCLIWALAGFVVGQIRTLNKLGLLANWAILINLFIMFISMGVMAELQHPRDFLKAMWGAQLFIYVCYMVYGCYVYFWQGQYANQISYQGLSPYAWQTVCNVLAVVSGIIAAVLYGNIGIKVVYNNVLVELLHAPPLYTRQGKVLWAAIVPLYWSVAFVLAAAIPDFFGLVSVTAAVCAVQFTYTFPALLGLGLFVKRGAMVGEPGFDPATGEVRRRDSGVRRFARGFFGKYLWLNVVLLVYMLGSLAVSGLGSYSAISSLISAFKTPQVTAFRCRSPLEG